MKEENKKPKRAGIQKVFDNYAQGDEGSSFVESIHSSLEKFSKKEEKREQREKKHPIPKEEKKKTKLPFWIDMLITAVIFTGLLFVFRSYVFSPFNVSGHSMDATLADGELIYTDILFPKIFGYSRGDVIVFYPPNEHKNRESGLICAYRTVKNIILFEEKEDPCYVLSTYIKRIIGIPGDTIEIKDGDVYITPLNGKQTLIPDHFLLTENQSGTCIPASSCNDLSKKRGGIFGPVPEGKIFVMGDNRIKSSDSRARGWDTPFVEEDKVVGVARAVFLSLKPLDPMIPRTKLEAIVERIINIPASFAGIRRIKSEEIIPE